MGDACSVTRSVDGLWFTLTLACEWKSALHSHPYSRSLGTLFPFGPECPEWPRSEGRREIGQGELRAGSQVSPKTPVFVCVSTELSVVCGRAPGYCCPRSASRSGVLGCSSPASLPQFALRKPDILISDVSVIPCNPGDRPQERCSGRMGTDGPAGTSTP